MALRIAVFSDSYTPILNGVSISIRDQVRELRNQGHSVHVFTSGAPGYQEPDPNCHRFFALETPWTRDYPLAMPPFYPMLSRFRRQRFDLIHTHTPFTMGFVGLRWAQSHGLPIVSTYHTLYDKYAHYIPYFPKRYIRYKCAKHTNFYYSHVNHVITPSDASARWLQRHSVTTPITVIATATAPTQNLERAAVRRQLSIGDSAKVLLYVGRIAREKNIETLLAAVAIAMQSEPQAMLVMVGDGPFREAARRLAGDLGIGDRVRFEGFVARDQVDRYYAMADVFAFASVTETQGLVVSEAMAYGLPAIVAQGGGAGAAVQQGVNGFLVRNQTEEIAEALQLLLKDEETRAELAAGALATSGQYDSRAMIEQVLGVYDQVLSSHTAQRTPVSAG
ncbi:MAG: glycosyltransferase [Chthonomonas sp.]|nr:glycosyltransferase [Chthonomonas sp.]